MTQTDRGMGETANQAAQRETTYGGTKLGQRIWDRYGSPHGVIPTAVTLGLARRASRLITGMLPLLVDVHRRWAPAGVSFPRSGSALPYARPPAVAGASSTAKDTALHTSATPLSPAVSTGLAVSQRTAPVLPAVDPATSEGRRRQPGKPGQPAVKAKTGRPGATKANNPGTANLQLYPGSTPGGAIQQVFASPEPGRLEGRVSDSGRPTGPPFYQSESASQAQPATKVVQHAVKARMEAVGEISGDLGTAILQRYLDSPVGRTMRQVLVLPKPGHLQGHRTADVLQRSRPPVLPSEGVALLQPSTRESQRPSDAQTESAMAIDTRDLGAVILRRHLNGLAGQAIQGKVASSEAGQMQYRGTAHVRRLPGEPFNLQLYGWGHMRISAADAPLSTVTSSMAAMQKEMGEAVLPDIAEPWQVARDTLVFMKQGRPPSPEWSSATRFGGIQTSSGPVMLLSRSVPPEAGWINGVGYSSRTTPAGRQELPLVRARERNTLESRTDGISIIQPRSDSLKASIDMPLQRTSDDTSLAMRKTETTGDISPPSANDLSSPSRAEAGMEGPDLERLADEVYAIIERRLTIERESLGA